jgi:drug/metabolite transporter (DMT)-like permease
VTIRPRRRWLADLSLLGITFIWGSTFVIVKKALESSSTLLFLALRFTLAALAVALLFRGPLLAEGGRKRELQAALGGGVVVGSVLFLGYLFQTLGLRLTTPAKSGFITGFSVALVPVFNAILYRAWPSWNACVGVCCATAGLYLLIAPGNVVAEFSRGDLLTLACAVAFGLHILLLGRYSRRMSVAALSVAQIGVAAVLSLSSFFWAEAVYVRWTAPLIVAVAVTGLLATALAFSVQTWAQQFTSPTHTALIFTLEPVFAWLTSYLLLGEALGTRGASGAVLILAGIILSELKP